MNLAHRGQSVYMTGEIKDRAMLRLHDGHQRQTLAPWLQPRQ